MNIAVLTQGLATLAWIVTVGLLILVLTRAARNRPMKKGASHCDCGGCFIHSTYNHQLRIGVY